MSARRHIWAVIAWCILAGAGSAAAQSKTGTTLGQFLLIEPSSRLTALGNTGVAADTRLDAAYYNPAAVGRLQGMEIQFSHADWFAGIRHDYVAAGFPIGAWGAAFVTITSLNSGEIDVRTVNQPLGTGERYTVSNLAVGLGYAYAVTERFSAGLQVRYLQETIWHSSADAVTFDVGTLYRLSPQGLHLGASLTNFGTSAGFEGLDLRITYDEDPSRSGDNNALPGERFTQDYPVPILFRAGVGYPLRLSNDLRGWFAVTAAHPSDNSESASGGFELTYREMVSARLGYQNLFKEDSEEGAAAGLGFQSRLSDFGYQIDYAWADYGRLESVHRLSFTVSY